MTSDSTSHHLPPNHPPVLAPKVGLLLLNLGTPDGCDTASVRRYLAEFLSDRRVISAPRWLWLPILHGIILRTRPRKSAHAYSQIWDKQQNASPLLVTTQAITHAVRAQLGQHPQLHVAMGMRYGNPSIAHALAELRAAGCRRILALALYPQYSATTTASAYDAVFDALKQLKWQPALRTAPAYHDDPRYIEALAGSIRTALANAPQPPDAVVASFHGLPKQYLDEGDPYHCFCQKTSRLLRESLAIAPEQWVTAFQSRFGPKEWLKPYMSDVIPQLAREGKKHIAVISPGFAADCIETLEELNIGLRESFIEAGGEQFTYIPCLNDSDDHIALITAIAQRELSGWL